MAGRFWVGGKMAGGISAGGKRPGRFWRGDFNRQPKMYPHCFDCSQNHPKAQKWGFLALLGDFGYSQNGGGTFSDFLIFFSPWLYLLITTSSSLKVVE